MKLPDCQGEQNVKSMKKILRRTDIYVYEINFKDCKTGTKPVSKNGRKIVQIDIDMAFTTVT